MLYIYIAIVVISVVIDQITKYAVALNMAEGQSIPLIENILHLTYITNDGAAMGMMDDYRWVFMTVSTVALIGISVWICICHKKISKLSGIAFSMVVGGGIGNMIDRVALGYVVDFIDFCAVPTIWMWVFNIADACVCVGAGLLVLWLILSMIEDSKQAKAQKLQADVTEGVQPDSTEEN